jgi:hypothetical protein
MKLKDFKKKLEEIKDDEIDIYVKRIKVNPVGFTINFYVDPTISLITECDTSKQIVVIKA